MQIRLLLDTKKCHGCCCHRASHDDRLVKLVTIPVVVSVSKEGGLTIAQFLEPDESVGDCLEVTDYEHAVITNKGSCLLNSLNLMSTGHTSLIECMAAASVPSTLVKCLYIFLDLPEKYSTGSTFHANEILVFGMFYNHSYFHTVQLLQRLCLYPVVAEELARKDALCHLFSALTDWCAPHNASWRVTTTVVLSTIAQNSMTPVVTKCVHDSECIRHCLKNLSESKSGSKDFVNSFVSLLHVVRESSIDDQILLDDFRSNNGYLVLSDFCLKLEENRSPDSENSLKTLVALVGHLAICGPVELRPKAGAGEQIHKIPGFHIHMPKTQGSLELLKEIGDYLLEFLQCTVTSHVQNGDVFIRLGATNCLLNRILHTNAKKHIIPLRSSALMIYEELMLNNGGEELMPNLLENMHHAYADLKIDILCSFCRVLRESHRCRTVFRKVNGFVYVMQELIYLEESSPQHQHSHLSRKIFLSSLTYPQLFLLIKSIFSSLGIAMKFEPSNAHYFATEIQYNTLTDAILSLSSNKQQNKFNINSCSQFISININELMNGFNDSIYHQTRSIRSKYLYALFMNIKLMESLLLSPSSVLTSPNLNKIKMEYNKNKNNTLDSYLDMNKSSPDVVVNLPRRIVEWCLIFRYFYNLAIDAYDRCLLIVITDLLHSERNQQLMCNVYMPREILNVFRKPLANDNHPLHDQIRGLFECLVIQALTPNDLREFLRLSDTLSELDASLIYPTENNNLSNSLFSLSDEAKILRSKSLSFRLNPLTLSQIKCLIAMSTPSHVEFNKQIIRRDSRINYSSVRSSSTMNSEIGLSISPPFVEFNMSTEGFGCLFLPSIAPQGSSSVAHLCGAVSANSSGNSANSSLNDMNAGGGVGAGERSFPPSCGFTYSAWVSVSRFDNVTTNSYDIDSMKQPFQQPQAVHLLTLVRGVQSVNDQLVFLRIYIHPINHYLVVSTQERLLQPDQLTTIESDSNMKNAIGTGTCAVFPCGFPPNSSNEWPLDVWRHVVVVFNRAGMIKTSSCSLYLDGHFIGSRRVTYIGASSASSALGRNIMPSSLCGFVGTPASMRRSSKLLWKIGPFHFIEEPLTANRIAIMTKLGPNYMGSFQAIPSMPCKYRDVDESNFPLFSEDKLVFGVYACNISTLTLSRIRKVYNQCDAKAIARQFYLSPKENATPIRILRNSALHLNGPARPLGAVLVGYQGVRTFTPSPVCRLIHCVTGGEGMRISLALIAMAQDVETLYASNKAACTLIKCNTAASIEMLRTSGYQIYAVLLRRKRHLLTTRILDSILSLALNMNSWTDKSPISLVTFEDLVCDLDLWRIERELTNDADIHIRRNALINGQTINNELIVHHHHEKQQRYDERTHFIEDDYQLVASLITHLIELLPNPLLKSDLPLNDNGNSNNNNNKSSNDVTNSTTVSNDKYLIILRNRCLESLIHLITETNGINERFCSELLGAVGFDWFYLLLRPHIHSSTISYALHLLLLIILNPGHSITSNSTVLQQNLSFILTHMETNADSSSNESFPTTNNLQKYNSKSLIKRKPPLRYTAALRDLKLSTCQQPGFTILQILLPYHLNLIETFLFLFALLLKIPVRCMPKNVKFDFDTFYSFIACENNCISPTILKHEVVNSVGSPVKTNRSTRSTSFVSSSNVIKSSGNRPGNVSPTTVPNINSMISKSPVIPSRNTNVNTSLMSHSLMSTLPSTFVGNNLPGSIVNQHSIYQIALDFIKLIVSDSFTLHPSFLQPIHIVDIILEAWSDQCNSKQHQTLQTLILCSLMDHFLATDILNDESLCVGPNGNIEYIPANLVYFSARIVDKLWQGCFNKEVNRVIDFLIHLITYWPDHSSNNNDDNNNLSIESSVNYYHTTFGFDELDNNFDDTISSLSNVTTGTQNNTVIPASKQQLSSLSTITTSVNNPSIDFNLNNNELPDDSTSTTLNYSKSSDVNNRQQSDQIIGNYTKEIVLSALKLWSKCYIAKKSVRLGGISSSNLWGRIPGTPFYVLNMIKQESCPPTSVATTTGSASTSSGLQHQISMKLSKVSGNVFKLGSSSHSGPLSNQPNVNEQISKSNMNTNTSLVNNNVQINYLSQPNGTGFRMIQENAVENLSFNQRHLESEWEKIEHELTRERGLWGRVTPDPLAKWELDPTEGPLRMRKRMILNKSFNSRYPYLPSYLTRLLIRSPNSDNYYLYTSTLTKTRKPRSRDSKLYFLNYKSKSLLHEDYGPLTPWLQLTKSMKLEEIIEILEEADNNTTNQTTQLGESCFDGPVSSDTDQQQKNPDDDDSFNCCTTVIPDSEFTELSQSLDPESLELSLQKTASLIRSTRNSVCVDPHLHGNDDLDELVTISTQSVVEEPDEFNSYYQSDDIRCSPYLNTKHQQQSHLMKDTSNINVHNNTTTSNVATSTNNTYQNVMKDIPNPMNNFVGANEDKLAGHEAILRLLEPGERLHVMYRCARILGLDIYEGLLLFGKAHFYVIDGYTLINTREIVAIDSLPPNIIHEPIVPCALVSTMTTKKSNNNTLTRSSFTRVNMSSTDLWSSGAVSQIAGKQYFKFPYENIQEVHKRRYLLHPIALEVFNSDGRNFLLAFSKGLQNKVYECFQNAASANSDFNQQKSSQSFFSSLLGVKSVVQRWEHGELSNFEYLMYLNTQAGRSYNDLIQYPVFPWVLADYESEELDLSRPETFRDLSKPMGAQTPDRLAQFQRRFKEWDDPTGETPPYHYGTHYSSAMIVASYLFRMEPFAQHFLKLQGGHFDLPDRMFHSVRDTWISASRHNMADVRELIPEFFYLPDFLINSNHFEMGIKQNGVEVNNVVLPPWAKSDPREFIRVHREALESEYVSAHLHEWIDLIFGYKQQGEYAIQAANVFHYLFYEGNVDIYSIDDPLKRSAVIGFINNFGQIPKQLFKKPHPCRRVIIPRPSTRFLSSAIGFNSGSQLACELFYRNLDILRPSLQPIKELKHAVGQIVQLDPQFIPIEQNKCLLPPNYTHYLAWGFTDGSLRLGSLFDANERVRYIFEMVDQNEILCCTSPNKHTIITAGLSTVVRVWFTLSQDSSDSIDSPCLSTDLTSKRIVQKDSNVKKWSRILVFRSKLTMHTAYERSDNKSPADITALAISRDHRSVLVGDAIGRVFVWSVPSDNSRGGMTDQWVKDEGATNCAADGCGTRFSLTERKHHCRNCGKVFCSKCSRFESEIYRLRLFKPVRVCQSCHNVLKLIQAPQNREVIPSS
ncbi:beige/beach protein-related [Schistosoma mansoni]|uniref:beige/beach protein-related n=1 Tax=Schistosoma mansoni TaxID=6183 RepID=UPI00022DCABD|nr:beige/beach protein-related [Schistosoma mansoni]|eukprot:XP_018654969.1 beige/beach protein-related [Schistosoma mansoni]